MSIMDKAKAHYKTTLGNTPRKLEVPEWESTVFIRPGLSLERTGEILELTQNGKVAEALALTLIHRLIDEEGNPIFRRPDKVHLMKSVDPDVLGRIVNEINESDPTDDDIMGN